MIHDNLTDVSPQDLNLLHCRPSCPFLLLVLQALHQVLPIKMDFIITIYDMYLSVLKLPIYVTIPILMMEQ